MGYQDAYEILKDALKKAQQKLRQQNDLVSRLTSAPSLFAVIISARYTPAAKGKIEIGASIIGTNRSSNINGVKGTITKETLERDGTVYIEMENGASGWVPVYDRQTGKEVDNPYFLMLDSIPEKSSVKIAVDGKVMEVAYPKELQTPINPGQICRVFGETMQIVEIVPDPLHGEIAIFKKFIRDDSLVEVSLRGETKIVYPGNFTKNQLESGDRLLLDPFGLVIVQNLGQEEETFSVENVNVSWDDIGGLATAKAILREAFETPINKKDVFLYYGKKRMKGVLLTGPAGCGKTMLGKAVATSISRLYNGKKGSFMYVKGPELLNHFVGDTEAAIRGIFSQARKFYRKYNVPVVIFFDEAESLLKRRGMGISTDVFDTIVPQFLAEMDGLEEETGSIVILATNRPDLLDPAVVRDQRISRVVEVERPKLVEAQEIFTIHMRHIPLNNGHTCKKLAETTMTALFDPDRVLYDLERKDGSHTQLTLGDVVSGAMVYGVVDRATSNAMRRDEKGGGKPSGVSLADIELAVDQVFHEQLKLDHTWDLQQRTVKDPNIVRIQKMQ